MIVTYRLLALMLTVIANLSYATDAKPNVLIIIADDLTWHDVACFGGPTNAHTPHLDVLAAQGMRLTRFYSPAAVCSPTRQALLTGLYPVRSGAYPNHTMVRAGTRSMPFYLNQIGYRTGRFSKTHFAPKASYPFDVETEFAEKGDKKDSGKKTTAARMGITTANSTSRSRLHSLRTKNNPSLPTLLHTNRMARGPKAILALTTRKN